MTGHVESSLDADFHIFTNFDEDIDVNFGEEMTHPGIASPYIKQEKDEYQGDLNHYNMNNTGFGMHQGHFSQQGIDPASLSMEDQSYLGSYPFNGQQNMSASFNMGNSGIGEDDLLALDFNQNNTNGNRGAHGQNTGHSTNPVPNYYQDQSHPTGISMSHQGQMRQFYPNTNSNTPPGAPLQSPFVNDAFNYDHFGSIPNPNPQMSPFVRPTGHMDGNFFGMGGRQSITAMERKPSEQRTPLSPRTPGIGGLQLSTPESGSLGATGQPIPLAHRHQKSLSNHYDSNSGSVPSMIDSPISSPGHPSHHLGITEMMKTGKPASLPTKTDGSGMPQHSQEAKRRRRRESHNMVERRRRDNINDRIQDLSHLVPQHRLDDDKVRKHLNNNSPLSPTLGATSMSPPQATSLLAGGNGRRAAGSITMGLPIEEKEKGPNKGDILNGAVGWTRDLMWALYAKIQQEDEAEQLLRKHGEPIPWNRTEEEQRMKTELIAAIEKNTPDSFHYSRAPGSGLRVPMHTNVAGEPLQQNQQQVSPQSLSPAFNSGGSGDTSGGQDQPQFWNSNNHAGLNFKEEDEYAMDI